jgi:hypothetical protein
VKLVLVAPRFPFPLDKGDRLTVHHLVRYLGARHQVWLACFLEPDQDPAWVDELRPHCEEVLTVPLSRPRAYLNSARAVVGRTPLQVRYYADQRMHGWSTTWSHGCGPTCSTPTRSAWAPTSSSTPTCRACSRCRSP